MPDSSFQLDLSLWKDKGLIAKQNQLKAGFWNLFSELGNSHVSKSLCQFHPNNKGIKLSKGNDLGGFPFHVLDLIRDFDPESGLAIRVLNWFGHGMFIFILFGKNHTLANSKFFSDSKYHYAMSPTPWDYPELILGESSCQNPDSQTFKNSTYHQWFREIRIENSENTFHQIERELKKISEFFDLRMG